MEGQRCGGEQGGKWGDRGRAAGLEGDGDDQEFAGGRYGWCDGRWGHGVDIGKRNGGHSEWMRDGSQGAELGGDCGGCGAVICALSNKRGICLLEVSRNAAGERAGKRRTLGGGRRAIRYRDGTWEEASITGMWMEDSWTQRRQWKS